MAPFYCTGSFISRCYIIRRLDHCIELSLPSPQQRLMYMVGGLSALKQKVTSTAAGSSPALERHSEEVEEVWVDWARVEPAALSVTDERVELSAQLLREVNAVDPERVWGINRNSSSSVNSSTGRSCPEMDLPEEDRPTTTTARSSGQGRGGGGGVAGTTRAGMGMGMMTNADGFADFDPTTAAVDTLALIVLLRACMARAPADSFQVLPCLKLALLVSAGWSYRDLKQLISALNYTILCSDRYVGHARVISSFYKTIFLP